MPKARNPSRPDADKRERFCQEYPKDFNATQAAIRSGYSAKTAKQQGSRLLSRVDVQEKLAAIASETAAAAGITRERTAREVARCAYADPRKLWHADGRLKKPHEWDDDTAATIASIESVEVMLHNEGDEAEPVDQGQLFKDSENGFLEKTMTRKVKSWDKLRALQQCIEILGMSKAITPGETGGLHITMHPYKPRAA
jgi:phage terminase small subunit